MRKNSKRTITLKLTADGGILAVNGADPRRKTASEWRISSTTGCAQTVIAKREPKCVATTIEPPTSHACLRYVRSEQMKARRRAHGDNGVKFQGRTTDIRTDGCTNTITKTLKENLIMDTYDEIDLRPDSVVEPLGDCRFRIDGRTLHFAIRKLTPSECFRLMDVDDSDIDTIQNAGISNSQQYKLAGNSIVVSVLYHIFRKMFIDTAPECAKGEVMSIF